ncbi:MAG: ABC transporter ATP-binding protein [Alphaproteobacteria bacterium]|nr:ABC transporter ATP-binding protein [Alphaproteobacteria bacterium]
MTAIRIAGVGRSFGAVAAVSDVTLEIGDGEFFTLLGPSGCGKTTLLRMVAGFCDLDRGSIHFADRRIDTVPPHKRNAGMVFQNYAIFPNLTVGGNVAYGLKARAVPPAAIAERVARALKLVQLGGYAERWPHQLSGGQLQRVALARCLVIEPAVLLLDEPLSNLDAQLRVEMRGEIRQLQKSLGITALYVTHDQEEAMSISDRIAVMRAGQVEQLGAPWEIYRRPATPFVARFMGTTNLLRGRLAARAAGVATVRAGARDFAVAGGAVKDAAPGAELSFSLRPEALRLAPAGTPPPAGWAGLEARIRRVEFLGALTRVELDLGEGLVLHAAAVDLPSPAMRDGPVAVAYDPALVTAFAGPGD